MTDRTKNARIDAKITELYAKHRGQDGVTDASDGSPLAMELATWLAAEGLLMSSAEAAKTKLSKYYERHRALRAADKCDKQAALFEEDALLALSADKAEHVRMGDATRAQFGRYRDMLVRGYAAQTAAFEFKINFVDDVMRGFESESQCGRDAWAKVNGSHSREWKEEAD